MAVIQRSVDLSVVGANGGGWVTDLGAAIPTTPTSYSADLDVTFQPLGAISEDGLAYGFDEDSEQYFAWGQLTPYRAQITRSQRTFQFTAWETNRPIVKSVMFRQPLSEVEIDVDGTFAFSETSTPTPDRRSWVFDVMDGPTLERFFVPVGEVTDRDDVSFQSNEIAGYTLTVTAYADSNGVTVYHLGHVQQAA